MSSCLLIMMGALALSSFLCLLMYPFLNQYRIVGTDLLLVEAASLMVINSFIKSFGMLSLIKKVNC